MAPLTIEIALHYHCCVGEFPRLDAPACRETINRMLDAGLLTWSDKDQQHVPTDGLRTYVEALCAIPWPVMRWEIPTTLPEG